MKTHTQAVVIGGGLVGCSILYHLTKLGWSNVVLLERDELTSGSTWHAAAGIHGLHDNNNISKLQYYTIKIYKELEAETGQGCGIFQPGSIYLAQTAEREHQLRLQASKARYFGVDFQELSLKEARDLHPLLNTDGIRCAMFESDGGNVDPSGVTHAYAKGARANGAEIHRFTPVLETNQRADGTWDVATPEGTIHTEVVINAAGLWGREVGRMAGLELPLIPMEHQYFVTEEIPQIVDAGKRLPSIADRDAEFYLRQEGLGLLVGAYEKDGRFWAEEQTPMDFGHELLPDDLDRISDNLERAFERVPALAEAGVKRVINGPMIWSPDSAALFGPVPELRNYYCCNGIIPGFSQSGGLGLLLAQWIVEGEPELDLFPWDLARFGDWPTKTYTKARALDCYANRFKIHFPYEEREAGRPLQTRPVYDKQKQHGAVFGLSYGWEHPLWYARDGAAATETYGFERQSCFDTVKAECLALRQSVGLLDVSNYAKYEITGQGCGAWLDTLIANHMPKEIGRSCLTPLLGVRGGIAGDFTVTKVGEDHYWMFGSGIAEGYHKRFWQDVPEGVSFVSQTKAYCGFSVAGPNSRALLQRLTNADLDNDAFKFMRSQAISIAGIDALAMRVSFTGDLGEKGYGSWGREYSPEYWPHEVGLDRLIKMDKPEFLGKQVWAELAQQPPREKLVMLSIETTTADATGGECIFTSEGTPVGRVSSGAYGHTVDKSLALCLIKTEFANTDTDLQVDVLGVPHSAKLLAAPPFDPKGLRLRS